MPLQTDRTIKTHTGTITRSPRYLERGGGAIRVTTCDPKNNVIDVCAQLIPLTSCDTRPLQERFLVVRLIYGPACGGYSVGVHYEDGLLRQ